VPPLKAVMLVRAPKAAPEDGAAHAAVPRIQNPANSKMLSLVDSLEEELFAAEARRHDAEARHLLLLILISEASLENPAASKMLSLVDRPGEEGSAAEAQHYDQR
jgi:hypothetical protein